MFKSNMHVTSAMYYYTQYIFVLYLFSIFARPSVELHNLLVVTQGLFQQPFEKLPTFLTVKVATLVDVV